MSRNSRIWQDSLAHATIYEGDTAECSKWAGWAIQKLQFMLHSRAGSSMEEFYPAEGVRIRVDTRPNRIMIVSSSGMYITLMEPDGTVGYYTNPAQPPYQRFKERRYYSKGQFKLRNDKYAGGQLQRIDTGNFVGTGGSWHNYKDKVVSWTSKPAVYPYARQETFYINGVMIGLGLAGLTGHTIEQACLKPPELSGTPGATHTLVVLFRYVPSSGPHELRLKLYSVNVNTEVISSVSSLLTIASYSITNASFTTTAFSPNGFMFAVLHTEAGAIGRQRVYLTEFSADYTSFTTTTIYDEYYQRLLSESEDTIDYFYIPRSGAPTALTEDWDRTITASASISGATPFIASLVMERYSLGVLTAFVSMYTSSRNLTANAADHNGAGDGSLNESILSESATVYQMYPMSYMGVQGAVVDLATVVSSGGKTVSLSYSNYDWTYSLADTSSSEELRPIYFSVQNALAALYKVSNASSETASDVGLIGDNIWSTTSETSQTVGILYFYKEVLSTHEVDSRTDLYTEDGVGGDTFPALATVAYIQHDGGFIPISSDPQPYSTTESSSSDDPYAVPGVLLINHGAVNKEFIGCGTTTVRSNPPVDWTFMAHGETAELLTYRIDKPTPAASATYYSPITIAK